MWSELKYADFFLSLKLNKWKCRCLSGSRYQTTRKWYDIGGLALELMKLDKAREVEGGEASLGEILG